MLKPSEKPAATFFKTFLWVIFCSAFIVQNVQSVSVMSVDLGSEWMKIAIVSPGVPMEIILNTDSQRKTPLAVAFRDGERFIGDSALNVGIRFPEKTFTHFIDLLGKTSLESVAVQKYLKRFPYHQLIEGKDGQTVSFLLKDNGQEIPFTPEELLSMMLKKAKFYAEQASASSSPSGQAQTITDCVLTVPPYFSQIERKAMKHAAQLAGLKVLQLINVNSAFALNYGVFRRKDFNSSNPTNILFYDMGAGSTLATIASYQLVKTKERGFTEIDPQLAIKATAYDRYLGGFELQLRLRDHLLKLFAEQSKKTIKEITQNKRAMAKLLKEAGRVKKVLSANNEHKAQIENVMNDVDLKALVTREQFETLTADLLSERVTKPLDEVFQSSGMQLKDIDSFIIIGGATRIPRIQNLLKSYWSKELSKNINADEAGALGAAYQAAYLSKGFKVKTFHLKDWNLYQINVDFERENNENDDKNSKKVISRTLFARGNTFPQKKVITFNKNRKNFEFLVNYVEPVPQDSPKSIFKVALSNVESIFEKYSSNSSVEPKGIKVHFRMDQSGLLLVENSDVSFEVEYEEIIEKENYDQISNMVGDAISKFGSKLSSLFSNNDQNQGAADGKNETLKVNQTTDEKDNANNMTKDDIGQNRESETQSKINVTGESLKTPTENDSIGNDAGNKTLKSLKKELKKKIVKEEIPINIEPLGDFKLSDPVIAASQEKLDALDQREKELLERNLMKNALESFIHETRDKLQQKEYSAAMTEQEREAIEQQLNQVSEWLDYESEGAKSNDFEEKLKQLQAITRDVSQRVQEHRNRPEALSSLTNVLNIADMFHANAMNVSKDEQIFSDTELSTLRKVIDETKTWMDDSVKEQEAVPLTSNPLMTVTVIMDKIALVDREVKYLLNKARITPKKQFKKPVAEKNITETEEEPVDSTKTTADHKKDSKPDPEQSLPTGEETSSDSKDINPEKTSSGPIKTEL